MYWSMFFIASVAVLSLSIVFALLTNTAKSKSRLKTLCFLKPFNILLCGVFLAAFLIFIPLIYADYSSEPMGESKTVVFAFLKAIRLFAVSISVDGIIENASFAPDSLIGIYTALCLLFQIVAPVMTVGFLLSFFKNITAYFGYIVSYFKDVYIFSALNKKSIVLARDIHKNHPKAKIVFTNVNDHKDESFGELSVLASDIGAIIFIKDASTLNFSFHSKNKNIFFFMMEDNEIEKINHSLNIIEKYKYRDKTRLYLFSNSTESELLLAGRDTGKVKFRRVNEIRAVITRVLCEDGLCIFDNAIPISESEKQISAVIVGIGSYGTEMLKALSWYCQMDGYRLSIDAFDVDKLAEERFSALCPELMSDSYNGVYVEGEAQYTIKIHSGFDVFSKSFCDEISKLKFANYVFVSLGSDEDNIKVAVQLRMLFERIGAKPRIQAVVYDTEVNKSLIGVKNYRGQEYNIDFIGDFESSYSENVIINSDIEAAALARHKKWGDESEFWKYEYNYRSSLASAIHLKARVHCGIFGATKKEEELTEEERRVIEILEHRRWNAYMRSEGYVYSGSKNKSSRNDLAKMHHDLVSFEELTEEEQRKDSRVGTV